MSIQTDWIKVAIISSWKEHGLLFEHVWTPYTRECFVSRLVQIGLLVLEKVFSFKCRNNACYFIWTNPIPFYIRMFLPHYISGSGENDKNVQREDGQQEIIKVYLSFQLRRAKTLGRLNTSYLQIRF